MSVLAAVPVEAAPPPVERSFAELGRSVAAGCASGFATAADRLTGGAVRVVDAAGDVLALSRVGVDEAQLRGRALVRDGRVLGRLDLARGGDGRHDGVLVDLAVVLLDRRGHVEELRGLRHRVSLLSWTSTHPEIARPVGSPVDPDGLCRPVVAAFDGVADAAPLRALRDAVAREPVLAGTSLVPVNGVVLGVCPDPGPATAGEHAAAWTLAVSAPHLRRPTVAVGRPARAGEALRASYDEARRVATLQREPSGILDVPRVAVVDELGPMADLLSAVSPGQVAPFVRRVLGGPARRDALRRRPGRDPPRLPHQRWQPPGGRTAAAPARLVGEVPDAGDPGGARLAARRPRPAVRHRARRPSLPRGATARPTVVTGGHGLITTAPGWYTGWSGRRRALARGAFPDGPGRCGAPVAGTPSVRAAHVRHPVPSSGDVVAGGRASDAARPAPSTSAKRTRRRAWQDGSRARSR